MQASILSIGDEIIHGSIIDTNASYIASRFFQLGIEVNEILCCRDNIEVIAITIKKMSLENTIVIVTGGLGPTSDDLTAHAAALAASDKLILNKEALLSMEQYFKQLGVEILEDNIKQAYIPLNSKVLINRNGTAPGFYLTINNCIFFFMPGVPNEMQAMLENEVIKTIKNYSNIKILSEKISIFGLTESKTNNTLKDFNILFPLIKIGFRVIFPLIEIKITCVDDKKSLILLENIKAAKNWILSKIGSSVVSDTGLSIEEEIGNMLTKSKKTLGIAESCTGGMISDKITNIAGSSAFFVCSAVTYSNEAKIKILDVSEEDIRINGAVHEKIAMQMAKGIIKKFGVDFALSVSGIAGPSGGSKEKPVGTVCIGIASSGFENAKQYFFPFKDRIKNKQIFAATALNMLRQHIDTLK